MPSLFVGNNRQHILVCAKIISSWEKNIGSTAKAHVTLGTLHSGVVSAALLAGVSLVSILQAGDWASFYSS